MRPGSERSPSWWLWAGAGLPAPTQFHHPILGTISIWTQPSWGGRFSERRPRAGLSRLLRPGSGRRNLSGAFSLALTGEEVRAEAHTAFTQASGISSEPPRAWRRGSQASGTQAPSQRGGRAERERAAPWKGKMLGSPHQFSKNWSKTAPPPRGQGGGRAEGLKPAVLASEHPGRPASRAQGQGSSAKSQSQEHGGPDRGGHLVLRHTAAHGGHGHTCAPGPGAKAEPPLTAWLTPPTRLPGASGARGPALPLPPSAQVTSRSPSLEWVALPRRKGSHSCRAVPGGEKPRPGLSTPAAQVFPASCAVPGHTASIGEVQ